MLKKLYDKYKNTITLKKATIVILLILAISYIPILLVSGYAFPTTDDFVYGKAVHDVFENGGSIGTAIQAAIEQAEFKFETWQGSFGAIFLMAFQPAVFGEEWYFLTTIIMLGILTLGMLLFLQELLVKWLKADRWQFLFISAILIFMTVHFCYDPVESFYWYNGAIYYTFFYSLSLILWTLVLMAMRNEKALPRTIYTIITIVLSAFIGTGNYTTALCTLLVLALITAVLTKNKDKRAILTGLVLVVGLITLIISVTAPGNAIRQAQTNGMNPVFAIIMSFALGAYIIFNSATFPTVIGFIAVTPLIYRLAKNSKQYIKHPLWFSVLSFGAFCSQCTPPLYGLGFYVPERLLNIIYFSVYILVLLNIYVWCSYLVHRSDVGKPEKLIKLVQNNSTVVFLSALLLFGATALCTCKISKDANGVVLEGLPFGAEAVWELINGDAKDFAETNTKRLEILTDTTQTDVIIPRYSTKPYLLYIDDCINDPSDWRNKAISQYYNKNTIKVQ